MCVHVNQLPDECLLPIFDLISLSELLQLDRVCARWKLLLWSACVRRRTLVLIGVGSPLDEMEFFIPFNSTPEMSFDGRRGRPYYDLTAAEREASIRLSIAVPDGRGGGDLTESDFTELARIRHARLGGRLATHLTELFPRVNNLVVVHPGCDDDELSWLIGLVRSSWTLKTLKLWIRIENVDDQDQDQHQDQPQDKHQLVRTLLRNMALQQPSLRQLSLDIDRNGYGAYDDEGNVFTFPPETYSFIAQLNILQFYLGEHYDAEHTVWDIVHRFDSTQLRHIALGNYEVHMEDVFDDRFTQLATKVRQIYFGLYFEDAEQLTQFGERFAALTALEMAWFGQFTFTQLVASLALLKQLTHLELSIDFTELQVRNPFALLVERGDDGGGDEEARPLSLPQVKILVLDIWTTSHRHFVSLSPRVFPLVELIIVDNQQTVCSICGPGNNNGENNREQNERCHRLLIRSLKNCFANPQARLHSQRDGGKFVDWTDYVSTDDYDEDVEEEEDDEGDDEDGYEYGDEDQQEVVEA